MLPTLHLHKFNFKPQPKQRAMDENLYITYFASTQGQFFKPQPKQMAMDENLTLNPR
jgi:hypothetical protein